MTLNLQAIMHYDKQMKSKHLFIGLMSGTSADGIDAALVSFEDEKHYKIIEKSDTPFDKKLQQSIIAFNESGDNELDRMGALDVKLGNAFADSVKALLKKAGLKNTDISAIGSHGQTIRHSPNSTDSFTLQIGDPNIIASKTGIKTVADFRRKDLALGGQGAPLAPAFHQAIFRNTQQNRIILNIGGIANITYLPKDQTQKVVGFDTGPGNVLLDYWIYKQKNHKFDRGGEWAASGSVDITLLTRLLAEPYLALHPPKSTGRELFNSDWLEHQLLGFTHLSAEDVQATLTEFTCQSITDAITMCDAQLKLNDTASEIYICGGGAKNNHIMKRLQALLPNRKVSTTKELGIAPDLVESVAFAWLAHRTINKLSGNLTSVTGAREQRVLGAVYCGN